MGYYEQSLLSRDEDFRDRVAACAAVELPSAGEAERDSWPVPWADANLWKIAAAPGFADAYSYAIETNVPHPGRDVSVIADEQILSAVQAVLSSPETEPEPL